MKHLRHLTLSFCEFYFCSFWNWPAKFGRQSSIFSIQHLLFEEMHKFFRLVFQYWYASLCVTLRVCCYLVFAVCRTCSCQDIKYRTQVSVLSFVRLYLLVGSKTMRELGCVVEDFYVFVFHDNWWFLFGTVLTTYLFLVTFIPRSSIN